MKFNSFLRELAVSALLIAVLSFFLTSGKLLMPMGTNIMFVVLLVLFFFAFAALVFREEVKDERDALHRLNAGRLSFLVGATLLVFAIIVQSFSHNIDPWLIFVLTAMILTKIISRIYSQMKN